MLAGEALQLLQGTLLLEHLGIALDGIGGVVDPGAAAGRFLGLAFVGGRIGAEEKLGVAGGGCPPQGLAV